MKTRINIKLFLSIALTITGFLVCITAFSSSYKILSSAHYPEAQDRVENSAIKKVNFIAVGDIMLSRNVARHAEKGGSPEWIWKNIGDFLRESDFNFGNLESPTNGTSIYSYQVTMIFNAVPELIKTLAGMNFSVINLANNHALDQGEHGLTITQKLLESLGIQHIGTGKNTEEAWEPKIIEKNGIKIAFIGASYAAYNDNGTQMSPMVARMQHQEKLKDAVKKAKNEADFTVVSMHGGLEYSRIPTELQTTFAHTAIESGADLVIGAHPHWTQKIESYNGKYIFYSLGNFVFDQEFSPETKTGLALRVFLEKENKITQLKKIELHPILIENYGQPRLMSQEASIRALGDIEQKNTILE